MTLSENLMNRNETEMEGQPQGSSLIGQLYTALALQCKMTYRELEVFCFEESQKKELAGIVGKNYAEENLILPISLEGTGLTLAVFIPEKAASLHELQTVYSFLHMECVLVLPDVFQALFFSLYGSHLALKTDPKPVDRVPDAPGAPGGGRVEAEPAIDDRKQRIESEVVQTIHYLIKHALNAQAESIHLEQDLSGPSIRLRVDGVLQMAELPWLEEKLPQMMEPILKALKRMAGLNASEKRQPQAGVFAVRNAAKQAEPVDFDVRAAFWPAVSGENATLRLFRRSSLDIRLEDLDHSFHVLGPLKRLIDESRGIVLIAGPAGSGRKETLYAAASHRRRADTKIIAIEETFTGSFPGIVQTPIDQMPEVSAEALAGNAAKHEPDIVLLSGLKDAQTAAAAFDLASGGIFVLCGMVADDAADALARLKGIGIPVSRMASCLKAVVFQRRVRKICRDCKEKYVPEPDEWRRLFPHYPASISFYRGKGCTACGFTGYSGSLILSELLVVDPEILAALDRGEGAERIYRLAKNAGLKTLFEDALVKLNRTGLDDLVKAFPRAVSDPQTSDSDGSDSKPLDPPAPFKPHAAGLPVRFKSVSWTLSTDSSDSSSSFEESNAGSIREMFAIYRAVANRPDPAPDVVAPQAEALFMEFITASFHHIHRMYGCSQVEFSVDNDGDCPELIAAPVRTAREEC